MTADPSARIVWIAAPIASPGQCGVCGKNEHPDGFVDPRMDFEFYGTLYFCRDCGGQIANVFGYTSPESLEDERSVARLQAQRNAHLSDAVKKLESALDSLMDARGSLNSLDTEPRSAAPESPSNSQSNEAPVEPAASPSDQPAEPTEEPTVIVSVEGPDDLPGTSSADRLLGL